MKLVITLFSLISFFQFLTAQPLRIHVYNDPSIPRVLAKNQGTSINSVGSEIGFNNIYFTKNGKPWYPIMGEIHFSRFPRELWEDAILKMKSAGIDIIASYIFWNFHEELKGIWDWKDQNDLRYFIELCKKHGLYVFLRGGPWCHGEIRYGGFPDWLMKEPLKTRSNDSLYLKYVKELFEQIAMQVNGYLFKQGGPVIGLQIENEFNYKKAQDFDHMLTLKKLAINAGIDVPMYSSTSWPGTFKGQREFLPVSGGYPAAPWTQNTKRLGLYGTFTFQPTSMDRNIGSDLLTYDENATDLDEKYIYPFATAELGGGNQITWHRRPIISSQDIQSLSYVKLGVGANLLGYYMYHGGINPIGKVSTLQESKATDYPNDYQIINYDFQAPLNMWGYPSDKYKPMKNLHKFLNSFGNIIATYPTAFPDKKTYGPSDSATLRWGVRGNEQSGFVFVSQHQRLADVMSVKNVQFEIVNKKDSFYFPQDPITINKSTITIFPYGFQMNGLKLNYATAQILDSLKLPTHTCFALGMVEGIIPELSLNNSEIKSISSEGVNIKKSGKFIFLQPKQVNVFCKIDIITITGKKNSILLIPASEVNKFQKVAFKGSSFFVVSNATMYEKENKIIVSDTTNESILNIYPARKLQGGVSLQKISNENTIFESYALRAKKPTISATLTPWVEENIKILPVAIPTSGKPLYGVTLGKIEGASITNLKLMLSNASDVRDVIITLPYRGDNLAVYSHGRIVTDDFNSGRPADISLRGLKIKPSDADLDILITPLKPEYDIYFEPGIREQISGVPAITSVYLTPVFEWVIE